MSRKLGLLAVISIIFIGFSQPYNAFAQNGSMVPQHKLDLEQTILGKTLEGFYQYQNVVTGNHTYTETYHSNGTLTYKEGKFLDKGKWWIENNQLCHFVP